MIVHCQTTKLAARDFAPVALSSYDALPKDIRWVGMYHGLVDSCMVATLFEAGLKHFPHLSGILCHDTWQVVPKDRPLEVELAQSNKKITPSLLEEMPIDELARQFLPDERHWEDKGFLLGVRIVHFPSIEKTVIGLRVSHCLVDGAGLSLFLRSALLSLSGKSQSPPIHNRALLRSLAQSDSDEEVIHKNEANLNQINQIPKGYEKAKSRLTPQDLKPPAASILFTIPIAEIRQKWQSKSLIESRVQLSAWLSAECKKAEPRLNDLAVWCDVRGIQGFPLNFTGNCGCFIHYPLTPSQEDMAIHWKHLTSRKGFKSIAEVFSKLKKADREGSPLEWTDSSTYLQINIVPHSIAHFDFGYGKALFGLLLARNSSGIRISVTPDDQFFLVEAELEEHIQSHLLHAANAEGFAVKLWGMGEPSYSR